MPTSRTNKILTAVVVVALIAAIGVLVFAYIPWGGFNQPQFNTEESVHVFLNGGVGRNFTLRDLWVIGNFTGQGGYRNKVNVTSGVGNYTGVTIKELVFALDANLSQSMYELNITAGDKYQFYNFSMVQGNVTIYNAHATNDTQPLGNFTNATTPGPGVQMVLIYAYNGQPLSGSDGHFKIGFLNASSKEALITPSYLWLKDVRTIQIIT